MTTTTKTYTDNYYYSSTYKKTWTVNYIFDDITASGSTFNFVTPTITAKFVGTSGVYRRTEVTTDFGDSTSGFAIGGKLVDSRTQSSNTGWCWAVPDTDSETDTVKGTSGTVFTITKRTTYYGYDYFPHTYTLNTSNYFKSSNKTERTLNVIGYFHPVLVTNTKSDGSGYDSRYDNNVTITVGTVTLNAPPTFTIGNIRKDTSDYYAGYTTITVPVSSISAKYDGYITKIELIVGSQISSKEFTETSQPSSTTDMTMLLNSAGTFTPQIRVTDSRGQTTTTSLSSEIVVKGYTSPSVLFSLARTSSNGKISDEGTSAVITANFTYENIMAKLSQPTVKIAGTTKTTTWYTTWNGNASSNNLSGAVNWTNYNPSSPITLYGLISGTFDTNESYIVGITPIDTISSGVETTQTLPPAFYTIDFKAGGKEIAFGAPANDDNIPSNGLFKCAMDFILKGENVLTDSAKYTRSSAGDIQWTNQADGDAKVMAKSGVAFWNGAYNGSSSNLKYSVNGEILGKTIVKDYIIENGSDGIWRYRKWNSGRIECWGEQSWENVACTTSLAGGYRSADVTVALPSGLFPNSIASCQATMKGSGGSGYTFALRTLCTTTTVTQMFWNSSSATKTSLTVDYYIIGS